MEVVIRPYRPEDAEERRALGDLCERTADAKIGGSGLRYHPSTELLNVSLVATLGNRIVGFIDGDQVMAPDASGAVVVVEPPEGYIHCIGVHPDFRRRGIGRRLLMAALKEYVRLGCVRVELGTPSPTAERLFLTCGGREFGLPDYPGNFEWTLPLDD